METVTTFFLNPSTDHTVIQLVQLYGQESALTPLFRAASAGPWIIFNVKSDTYIKPSQTRLWSRLKPIVMVVDNNNKTKKTIFGRNRSITKTQRVLASTNILIFLCIPPIVYLLTSHDRWIRQNKWMNKRGANSDIQPRISKLQTM